MIFWAFSGFSQRAGSSASAFSSSRRRRALSQSKMPPQQGERGADLARLLLDLSAHGFGPFSSKAARTWGKAPLASMFAGRGAAQAQYNPCDESEGAAGAGCWVTV